MLHVIDRVESIDDNAKRDARDARPSPFWSHAAHQGEESQRIIHHTRPLTPHTISPLRSSCRRLLDCLADSVPPLLLRKHDCEPLKVVELPALLDGGPLLRPRGLVPLLDGALLLELFADHARACGARELGQDEGREGEVAVGEGLAGHAGCGAVDDCLGGWEG